ncbi:YaeQ family protein [Nitrincola tapanii]|uniref:YaeQ family protein n=1 Tax=Nitrincola tapanii TaxID=1708751 RepID=A0A5A9VZM3_9GAMM|nr:YaeQ family protein [Nitrincola tapanii]KAA0873762.1 YaeQ family protein [Nitrincola tapanii]
MAQKARVIRVQLQLADMDRQHYQDYSLTLAQHPSETDERLMVRLMAFALNASETLEFARDLSDEDGAELWSRNLQGEVELWICFGQPDEKWLRKACQKSKQVKLYAYGARSLPIWWQQIASSLQRFDNLEVWELPEESVSALGQLLSRGLQLQVNIHEGQIWVSTQASSVCVEPIALMRSKGQR